MRWITNLLVEEALPSTNETLMRASLEQYPFGTALLALRQSQGRGRADRSWESTSGGMYLSLLFKPSLVEGLTLAGALAVLALCQAEFSLTAQLRWPNDVTVNGKKLAGVLPQVKFRGSEIERAVLGVGLNVNQPLESFPPKLQPTLTTLSHLQSQRGFEVEEVAQLFLPHLNREIEYLHQNGVAAVCRRAQECLEGLGDGSWATLEGPDGEQVLGAIRGLGPNGELLVGQSGTLDSLSTLERLRVHRPD